MRDLAAGTGERETRRDVPIHRADGDAAIAQQPRMSAVAAGWVEHRPRDLISGTNRFVPPEDGTKAQGASAVSIIVAENCGRHLCGIKKPAEEMVSMILFTLRCTRGHEFEGWFR